MKVSECSGSTLAYLGDAVFSLLVREHLIEKGYGRAKDLQRESIRYVSAKAQAHFFHTVYQKIQMYRLIELQLELKL